MTATRLYSMDQSGNDGLMANLTASGVNAIKQRLAAGTPECVAQSQQ